MLNRKQETRRKIQLGGLIVKAGLQDETTAMLYGMLLEAGESLASAGGEKIRTQWKIRGDIAFTSEE